MVCVCARSCGPFIICFYYLLLSNLYTFETPREQPEIFIKCDTIFYLIQTVLLLIVYNRRLTLQGASTRPTTLYRGHLLDQVVLEEDSEQ